MKALGGKQIFVVAGAVILFFLLFFLPRKKHEEGGAPASSSGIATVVEHDKSELEAGALQQVNALEAALVKADAEQKTRLADSLGRLCDSLGRPALAAWYFEQAAEARSTEKTWLNAAFRYFDGFRTAHDSAQRSILVGKAIAAYGKVLELNPKNLNAKTDLGVCYTETSQPMKGIALLREVIQENPEHENAQMNLGLLSMKSGQYDKAVERFEKVMQINPERAEAYLYLGESYLRTERREQGISMLERYKSVAKDKGAIEQVDRYIEQIKNNQAN
jgi:outer membrane protein